MTRVPDFTVIHQDEAFIVINKPSGLRAVPAKGSDVDPDLADSVETRVRERFSVPKDPIMAHRLDRDTSGLMVVALNRLAHRALSRQFMHRKVGKAYTALLDGHIPPPSEQDEGAVDLPICVDWPNRPKHNINFTDGKPARTLYRVLAREHAEGNPVTRVNLKPITGRTHQLRVHALLPTDLATTNPFPEGAEAKAVKQLTQGGIGTPIAGDTLYGPPKPTAPRLNLHASHLAFWHPINGEWQRFDCEPEF